MINKQITDNGLSSIAKNCKLLESLNFKVNSVITDFSLIVVANNCKNLKILILNGVKN
jgi:hypothetical protein